jgi:hypothetical protein
LCSFVGEIGGRRLGRGGAWGTAGDFGGSGPKFFDVAGKKEVQLAGDTVVDG